MLIDLLLHRIIICILYYNFKDNRKYKIRLLNEIKPSTELGKMMNKKIKYILNKGNKIE